MHNLRFKKLFLYLVGGFESKIAFGGDTMPTARHISNKHPRI